MNQNRPPETLQPFPPFNIREDIVDNVLSKWLQEVQARQSNCPYQLIDSFVPAVTFKLLQQKRQEICSAFFMEGGWESWFQVELALCFQAHGYQVKREQHIFKNSLEAADLVVVSPQGIRTIIELKCEGLMQDITEVQLARATTRPNFALRIEEDINKFGLDGNGIDDLYRGSFFCCVGVSGTLGSTDAAITHQDPRGGGRPWFDGISIDRIALHGQAYDLIPQEQYAEWPHDWDAPSRDDHLLMWWSGMHLKM